MQRKFLAFDLEIAKVLPDDADDLKKHRPLGITCAAMLGEDEDQPHLWYSTDSEGTASPKMRRDDLIDMVDFLKGQVANGYTILTWNGLFFDFDILAEESGRLEDCQHLSIDHVDAMFHVFCMKGFPVGLEPASKAIGFQGKTSGIDGKMAPKLWADGQTEKVLEYVANDCSLLLAIALQSEATKCFQWITRRGSVSECELLRGQWRTVRHAMRLPEPDTSWMSNSPWPRSRFTAWWR